MLRRARRQARTRQLWAADATAVENCLEVAPLETVFLRSEIRLGALRQGAVFGLEHPEQGVLAVALIGTLLVPWAPNPRDLGPLAAGLRSRVDTTQLIVGQRDQVAALQTLLAPSLGAARLVRAEQPHYAVDLDSLQPPPERPAPLRRAGVGDLEAVVEAGAAMHLEEVGFDPLQLDADGYRERMLTLIRRGWVWIWLEAGSLCFKAECSAVTAEAVQIQGVWTRPEMRRQGMGTLGMATLAQRLLQEAAAVTLFVNDFNQTAIGVYERVGFRRIGTMRSVLF